MSASNVGGGEMRPAPEVAGGEVQNLADLRATAALLLALVKAPPEGLLLARKLLDSALETALASASRSNSLSRYLPPFQVQHPSAATCMPDAH